VSWGLTRNRVTLCEEMRKCVGVGVGIGCCAILLYPLPYSSSRRLGGIICTQQHEDAKSGMHAAGSVASVNGVDECGKGPWACAMYTSNCRKRTSAPGD
jgi:hypothetical protein